jgi:hypothetical protein
MGAAAAVAAGAALLLGAGVCDHAAPDMHSETAPAKIKPAAIRMVFFLYRDRAPGLGVLPSRQSDFLSRS